MEKIKNNLAIITKNQKGTAMQTLTITASENKIKEVIKFVQSLKIDFKLDDDKAEFDEKIKNYKGDLEAYKNGTLATSPLGKGWKYI